MLTLYNLIIHIILIAIKIHSFINKKSREWFNGRKNIFAVIESKTFSDNLAWFHCASLGEYEQTKELIVNFKKQFKEYEILITFFSPSGFNNFLNSKSIDWVFYLPIDTKSNAQKFIEIVKPKIVFFIKSEFWYNYMNILHQKQIPLFHVSCNFRNMDFAINNSLSKRILAKSSHFFVQNLKSKELLNNINIDYVTITGDSRFDSIKSNIELNKEYDTIKKYCQIKPTIIFASIWPEDEHIYINFINQNTNYNYVIVPHELNYCKAISSKLNSVLYSNFDEKNFDKILLIDEIGILKDIYKYCEIAYIGGGFGKGIHNLIEATANNIPVIFGPNHNKFKEAKELIKINAGKSIKNYIEFVNCIKNIKKDFDPSTTKEYFNKNSGASKKIIDFLKKNKSELFTS